MTNYVTNHGACGICGKILFGSRKTARSALRRMLSNGISRTDEQGRPLRVYRACDRQAFHLGHSSLISTPNLNDPRLRWVEG